MPKPFRYAVKIFVSLMALIAIGAILFIWRVSNGPVELKGYSPFLRNLLVEQGIGQNINFDRSILTWRSSENNPTGRSSFEVRFLDVEIENPETGLALRIPQAGVQFSPTAMFRGVLAPTFVEFSGLELNILLPGETWNDTAFDQDAFIEAMRAYLYEFNNSQALVPRLTRQILSPPSTMASTGYLEQLTLANTQINITDESSGTVWKIPDALFDIRRFEEKLNLLLEGEIDFQDEKGIPLGLTVQYDPEKERAETLVRFADFVPRNLAGEVEGLAELSTLNIPIGGMVGFSLDKDFDLPVFEFEFEVGEGLINPDHLYNEAIKIDEAILKGKFNSASNDVGINEFYLEFDGAVIEAEGTISDIRDNPDILVKANVANMPLANLAVYWPPDLLKNARLWIENNITSGMIPDGVIDVNIRSDMWMLEEMPDDSFVFNFNLKDAQSHYLKPMPQLTEIDGTATLTLNHFVLNVNNGKIEDVDVEGGVLHFNDIAKKGLAYAHFELPINGRVEDILRVIDHEPLGYPSQYGIKADSILGKAQTFLTLDFPLIKELKIKDVEFDVQADIEDLKIPKLSDELTISEGTMSLSVNRQGIISNGNIVLNGTDFAAEWKEDFTESDTYPTAYTIEGDVMGDDWDRLGLPFEPYLTGPARAFLTLQGNGADLKVGRGSFDLVDTEVEFEPLGWVKNRNDRADVEYGLTFEGDDIINVNDIKFNSETMKSDIQLVYQGERTILLYIEKLEMPDQDFSGLFEWDHENRLYQVSIKGDKFNAVPLMDIILGPKQDGEEASIPDFNLAGSIANVSMYNDVDVKDATVLTGYISNDVIDFGFGAKWDDDKNLSILIATEEDGDTPQKLTLKTNDAGQALRALDFFTSGDQGELLIEADMAILEKGYSIAGTIEAGSFSVANSKAFSELLKEKEFAKAQEELEKNGLSFESFESEFTQYDEILTFISGSAKGPTLGITLDGYVDQKFDELSIGGTIIPAYGINSLLSNIPLIGTILAGGRGEGVFAATYNMAGSIEEPDVKINPLMALAPGILRKIFGAIGGGGNNEPTAREEAEMEKDNQASAANVSQGEIPPE